ncbi:MAG: filamentous hemagglutinin N-terminal domain-containing protein, partial [Phycisphaerae bacterium]|nr:filamentous hemagglutinin N-terminal domain-containing protein [Phycisphaerae bacterium]
MKGTASFDTDGRNWTITTSNKSVIHWTSFNVDAGATTRFIQPGRNAIAVNRVTGPTASHINGLLTANGRLVLINPNGVMVGPSGIVRASSFLASTLDASDHDLLSGGDIHFFGDSTAGIRNLGTIEALNGNVTLIAQNIINEGSILAPNGSVNLAAGSDVLLTSDGDLFIDAGGMGIVNAGGGVIDAAQAQLKAHHDNVYALAINNEGIIRATGTTERADGRVILQGTGGAGVINAGEILATNADGRGGYIDTSSAAGLSIGGSVRTGAGGEWLIDPTDLWVVTTANGTYSHEVEAAAVSGSLNAGGNVVLRTLDPGASGGVDEGDINVTATIEKTAGGDGSLILRAHDDILIHGGVGIVNSSPDGTLDFRAIAGYQGGTGHSFSMFQSAGNNAYVDIDGVMHVSHAGWVADLRDINAETLRVVGQAVQFRGAVQTTGNQIYDTGAAWAAGGSLHSGGNVIFHGDVDGAKGGGPRDFTIEAANSIRFYGDIDPSDAGGATNTDRALGNVTLNTPTVWLDGRVANAPTSLDSSAVDLLRVLSPNARIQDGLDIVSSGGRVRVDDGTYNENVVINKDLTLVSDNGRGVTTIQGVSGVGSLGTVMLTNNTTDVRIGGVDHGFTIVGIDNGNPAIENAAVYLQQAHDGTRIIGNEIVANGDHGLVLEYGYAYDSLVIRGNIFSGQTFVGTPAGDGFSQQFTLANVPRMLASIAPGNGVSNLRFVENVMTGTAGGTNAAGNPQGNVLVDCRLSGGNNVIRDNVFGGTTTRYGMGLRLRDGGGAPVPTITGNTFQADAPTQVWTDISGLTGSDIVASNTIVGPYAWTSQTGYVSSYYGNAVGAATAGETVYLSAGTFNEAPGVLIDKDLSIVGAGRDQTVLTPDGDTGDSGDARGWWVVDGAELNLSDLAFDGNGQGVYQAVRHKGSGTIDNVAFRNILYNASGPHYAGIAVAAFGNDTVDITNSTFDNIGRVGALYFS